MLQEGDVVTFIGYQSLDEDVEEILEVGEKVQIINVIEKNDGGLVFNVRPFKNGGIDYERPTEQLFEDEFEAAIEADTEPAQKPKKQATSKPNGSTKADIRADLPPPEAGMHDPVVTELIRSTNDVTDLAHRLYEEHEELYYKLGGVLLDIKDNKLHVEAGYDDDSDGFAEYVKDKIGPAQRTAYYLIATYKRLREANLTSVDLQGIGWTKARLIKDIKDPEEIREFVEKAKTMSRAQLEEEIEARRNNGNRQRRQRFSFAVEQDGADVINKALEYAMKDIGNENKNLALEKICTSYLMTEVGFQIENGEEEMEEEGAREI